MIHDSARAIIEKYDLQATMIRNILRDAGIPEDQDGVMIPLPQRVRMLVKQRDQYKSLLDQKP